MMHILAGLFLLILAYDAAAAEIKQGPYIGMDSVSVSGQILLEDKKPMPGGIAGFFNAKITIPPQFGSLRRIPDLIAIVDQEGRFSAELPVGRYFLGAIVRDVSKNETGPPGQDEKAFFAMDPANKRRIFEIPGNGAAMDLGTITVAPHQPDVDTTDFFTIRGDVIDKKRRPFANAWILIKLNPDAQRPAFISEQIGADGKFELQLPPGRPYFLIAKDELNTGRPQSGRYVGAYTGDDPLFDQNRPEPKPVPLTGKPGEIITGIKILMIEVTDFELQQKNMQEAAESKQPKPDLPAGK